MKDPTAIGNYPHFYSSSCSPSPLAPFSLSSPFLFLAFLLVSLQDRAFPLSLLLSLSQTMFLSPGSFLYPSSTISRTRYLGYGRLRRISARYLSQWSRTWHPVDYITCSCWIPTWNPATPLAAHCGFRQPPPGYLKPRRFVFDQNIALATCHLITRLVRMLLLRFDIRYYYLAG